MAGILFLSFFAPKSVDAAAWCFDPKDCNAFAGCTQNLFCPDQANRSVGCVDDLSRPCKITDRCYHLYSWGQQCFYLGLTVIANPASGQAPLSVSITADVLGTPSTSPMNFYYDCDNNGTFEKSATNIVIEPYTYANVCNFLSPGTKIIKVMVQRQGISYTTTTIVSVTESPTFSVSLSANPSSGEAPLYNVDLTATVAGTATGNIDYEFDCMNDGTYEQSVLGTASTSYTYYDICNYPAPGTYTAQVRATRQGIVAINTTNIVGETIPFFDCAAAYSCSGNRLFAEVRPSIATSSLEVYESNGIGNSLWGSFCYIDRQECTDCIMPENTDFRTPEIKSFQYRFDNAGNWVDLVYPDQWYWASGFGFDGCYVWTGPPWPADIYSHDMYRFNPSTGFNLNISALSPGSHTLNLRAIEVSTYELSKYPLEPDTFTYTNTFYRDVVFTKNSPPTVTLVGPANGSYVNVASPNPTFSATVTDSNVGQTVFAHFQVVGFGENNGSSVITTGLSTWGPIAGIADGTYIWRAYAEDSMGTTSPWSGYWSFTKDTIKPLAIIDQENGTSADTSIWVNLTESDERSGIAEGDVDVRINGGSWVNTGLPNGGSTTDDFTYAGTNGSTYEFRYQVKDGAGNWSDYAYDGSVTIDINRVTCNDAEIWNYCLDSRHPTLEWNYSGGGTQASYQVQADETSNFSSVTLKLDTEEIESISNRYTVSPSHILRGTDLNWNTKYYWRIKVKDNEGSWSVWCSPICSFTTPSHAYPAVDFSWLPSKPSALESVQFIDETEFYNGANAWSWTFENAVPASSILQNPVATFSSPGSWDVKLEATDSAGFMCPKTKSVKVSLPLPEWKEIIPR